MSETDPPGDDSVAAILVVRRTIRAKPAVVFAAWTEAARIRQWWGPGPVTCPEAEVDLRVGGRYRIANKMPNGTIQWIVGRFEAVEPPRRLVYSWGMGEDSPSPERVTVRFEPRGEDTEVIIHHENLVDPAAREMHLQGWEGCLDGLAAYLG
jgi:uncharacterized protein YndB with AHSA1/START domain